MSDIKKLNNIINGILKISEYNLTLDEIRLIFLIMEKGKVNRSDICENLSMSNPSVSWNVAKLCDQKRFFVKNRVGILEIQKSENNEINFVNFSKEGQKLVDSVHKLIKEKSA